jgi:ribosomal protein S12 methylthiotransferase accessory factor
MPELSVTFAGNKKVQAEYKGQRILTDQPKEAGGDGSGPTPFVLFLASLGTCAGYYVLGFCQARGLSTEGIRLTQRFDFDPEDRTLSKVAIDIHVPQSFPAKYHEALIRAAEACAVKKAIQAQPLFEVKTVVSE